MTLEYGLLVLPSGYYNMAPCPTFGTLVYGLPVRGVQADRTLQGVHQFINMPVRASWPTGQEVDTRTFRNTNFYWISILILFG
jgi:hypothetical protein